MPRLPFSGSPEWLLLWDLKGQALVQQGSWDPGVQAGCTSGPQRGRKMLLLRSTARCFLATPLPKVHPQSPNVEHWLLRGGCPTGKEWDPSHPPYQAPCSSTTTPRRRRVMQQGRQETLPDHPCLLVQDLQSPRGQGGIFCRAPSTMEEDRPSGPRPCPPYSWSSSKWLFTPTEPTTWREMEHGQGAQQAQLVELAGL